MKKTKILSLFALASMIGLTTSCRRNHRECSFESSSTSNTTTSSPSKPEPTIDETFTYYDSDNIEFINISDIKLSDVVELKIPEKIHGKDVVGILHHSIQNLPSLKKVFIPKTVIKIDTKIFANCPNLEEIEIDEENPNYKVVNNCIVSKDEKTLYKGIKTSIIPDTVTKIENYSFYYSNITSVKIPKGVSDYDRYFYHCDDLVDFQIDEENPRYSSPSGSNCWLNKSGTWIYDIFKNGVIPDTVKIIDNNAFCQGNIEELHLGKNINIEETDSSNGTVDTCFGGLYMLNKITVDPENIHFKSVDDTGEGKGVLLYREDTSKNFELYKMYGKEVIIPEGVTKIVNKKGGRSNYWDRSLRFNESIHFPSTFTYIFRQQEYDYITLNKITVAENNPTLKVVDNMLIYNLKNIYLAANDSIGEIPEGVTYVSSHAFSGTNITKFHLSSTVSSFYVTNCLDLREITCDENNPYYKANKNCLYKIEKDTNLDKVTKQLILVTGEAEIDEDTTDCSALNSISTGLISLKIPSSLDFINNNIYSSNFIYYDYFIYKKLGNDFKKIDLSSTSIDNAYLIANNDSTEEIIFPDNITTISSIINYGNIPLTSVTIPDTVTTINCYVAGFYTIKVTLPNLSEFFSNMFYWANNLTDLTIKMTKDRFKEVIKDKSSMTNLFKNCKRLTEIKFLESEDSSNLVSVSIDEIF